MAEKPINEKNESRTNDLKRSESDQVNHEKAVSDIEKQHKDLFERAPIGIFRTHSDGQSLYVNAAMTRIMGFASHEEMNQYYNNIGTQVYVHPERREQLLQILREKEYIENFEYEARTGTGKIIWLSLNAHISEYFKDGTFIVEGFATDVSERKKAEEHFRKSEAHLRSLLYTIPDLVWLKDSQGAYLACNPRFENFVGAKQEEIIGKTDYDFVDIELADFFREHDKRAIESGKPCKNEETLTFASDGHRETIETIKTPMFSAEGELIGVLGIGRDITERRWAEQEREILIAAIEQTGEMITLTDSNAVIQYVNIAFERVTGYSREEAIGQTLQLLESDMPEEAYFQKAWARLKDDGTYSGRDVNRRKDGTHFTVDTIISPIRSDSDEIVGYVSVKRDVTENLSMEAQVRQSQKMESVGRLAGGVAHDFNNMLSVILGNAELAMLKLSPNDPLQSQLLSIADAANRSSAITRQLLAFARKQAINPKILDLNDTVEGLLKMTRRLIGENIDLIWIPKANLWNVKMDPSQIDQILMNLCINARDAISNVGKIVIETENVTFDEEYCADHAGSSPGAYTQLSVSDDGSGMDREILSQIFEPFFTTKVAGKGSGLGLATAYGIVKQNNGFINAYSEPGKGTTIKVYLPRHEGADVDIDSKSTLEVPLSRGETVLLVEDEVVMMDVVKQMLENLGYKVLAETSPIKAINFSKQNASKIDLLITDVIMPEMNGRELADQIKNFLPTIKILFMSGYTSNLITQQGDLEEGMILLQKPFSRHDLAVKIRMALDHVK